MKKIFSLQKTLRILLSRVDNIGDVVLTLPMAAVLKHHFPHCQIVFLAREYVRGIIEACPTVDEFLSWDKLDSLPSPQAITQLQQQKIDIFIHVFPKAKLARLAAKAKIKHRLGTNRRWYHYLYCNLRAMVRRSQSNLHEAQLNLLLLSPLGIHPKISLTQLQSLIQLNASGKLPPDIEALIDPRRFNLILHPFSHGHAKEWPLEYYIELIQNLSPDQFNIFITGSITENAALQPLLIHCPQVHALCGRLNLEQLLNLIARCGGLIAASTGPLHMAAGLGIKTLGLFPPPQGINPQRWGPIGSQAEYLVKEQGCQMTCLYPEGRTCACLRAISVEQVKEVLNQWHLQ